MEKNKEKFEHINNKDDLRYLVDQIDQGSLFAKAFKFENQYLFLSLLEHLSIDIESFQKKYFHFDKSQNLHISVSEFEYVWISTYGLIAKGQTTDNNLVNACLNQYAVLSLIVEEAIEVSLSENVYDVDSYNFGYLSQLSPALFNNILFYIEVFGKAYLTLVDVPIQHGHKLSKIYSLVLKTMSENGHNNSFLHLLITDAFQGIIDHVSSIPGDFKEQFVKYDDNPGDPTVILFDTYELHKMRNAIDVANDFIYNYYFKRETAFEVESGIFECLLDNAKTKEEKRNIIDRYGHLKN